MGLGFTKIGIGQSKHGTAVPERRNRMAEWISVKDRLPMKNYRVLVYRPEMKESDVGAVSVQFGWNCRRKKTDITHWMPLPEPPSERGDTKIKTVPGHGELSNDQADNMAAYIDHQMQRVNCIENEAIEEAEDG